MADASAVARQFLRVQPEGSTATISRDVPIETPVAIEYNGIGYAVMMATPADLDDFAVGFSRFEGIIEHANDISATEAVASAQGVVLRIAIAQDRMARVIERARLRVSESSCGLCGLESIEQVVRPLVPIASSLTVEPAAIFRALAALRDHQPLNAATGAAHAAAFCAPDGTIRLVREDVGRHNALDKLYGAMLRQGIDPAMGFTLLSARCSFELVQKAIIARCPMVVTLSAATSIAVDTAVAHNLQLVSLARPDAFLFSGDGNHT